MNAIAEMNGTATLTTNYFTMNHVTKKIVGSEHHFKLSGKANTPQYFELMGLMAKHPGYGLVSVASKKKVAKKQTYAGLNKDLILKWLETTGKTEDLTTVKDMLADKKPFPTVKSCFLENNPGITVKKMHRDIQKETLEATKTKYKVVKAKNGGENNSPSEKGDK